MPSPDIEMFVSGEDMSEEQVCQPPDLLYVYADRIDLETPLPLIAFALNTRLSPDQSISHPPYHQTPPTIRPPLLNNKPPASFKHSNAATDQR